MEKSTQTCVLPLLELPKVVVDQIITLLPPRTCLTLRRVCKQTNEWISSMPRGTQELNKWKKYQLTINGKAPCTFSTAARMNLPITTFYLQNISRQRKIYESDGVEQFIELYKNRPISFVVDILCMLQSPEEQQFYFNFEKVAELRVNKLRSHLSTFVQRDRTSFILPPVTLTSSVRKIVIKDCDNPSSLSENLSDYFILKFVTLFKNLEYLCPPPKLTKLNSGGFPWFFRSRMSTYCPEWINAVGRAITNNDWNGIPLVGNRINNQKATTTGNSHQLSLDLRTFTKGRYTERAYETYVQRYVEFLQAAYQRNILLHSVYAPLLETMYSQWLEMGWEIGMVHQALGFLENVVTLYGIGNALLFGFCEMNKLEDISIFHNFGNHQWLYHNPRQLDWEHLKTVRVSVYISERNLTGLSKEVWEVTFLRIFNNSTRSSVANLNLKLRVNSRDQKDMETLWKVIDFQEEMFNVPTITKNFSNLKSLTIHGWLASTKLFIELFSGLPQLEYVNIGACKRLSDIGFKNISWGVKTLVLYLDDMPLLTSYLFINFLSRMPLKELWICSKKPLSQITFEAILALQVGTFGKTVEKFPFHTWKSKHIKEKEKAELQKGFRHIF